MPSVNSIFSCCRCWGAMEGFRAEEALGAASLRVWVCPCFSSFSVYGAEMSEAGALLSRGLHSGTKAKLAGPSWNLCG